MGEGTWLANPRLSARWRSGGGGFRQRRRRPVDGAGVCGAAFAGAQRADLAGLRLLRNSRSVRRAGAVHAQSLGRPRILQDPSWPGCTAGLDRPQPAEREGQLTGGGAPVCRDRWTDRRQSGETAGCGGQGPRADLDLRSRGAGRHRDHRTLKDRSLRQLLHEIVEHPVGAAAGCDLLILNLLDAAACQILSQMPLVADNNKQGGLGYDRQRSIISAQCVHPQGSQVGNPSP
ncbi:hypothetical protein EMIT0215P_130189 [Pseudomonas serboccidentalis]